MNGQCAAAAAGCWAIFPLTTIRTTRMNRKNEASVAPWPVVHYYVTGEALLIFFVFYFFFHIGIPFSIVKCT